MCIVRTCREKHDRFVVVKAERPRNPCRSDRIVAGVFIAVALRRQPSVSIVVADCRGVARLPEG